MRWYCALNAESIKNDNLYSKCVEVAVLSALQHTSLHPHFIFDGLPCALTDRLTRLGAQVIYHRSSLSDAILAADTGDASWRRIAHGAYLRVDVPLIDARSDIVLYTDCDVMFLSDPLLEGICPEYFAVAPEFTLNDYGNMNSGVMLMNLAGMRSVWQEFNAFLRQGLLDFDAYDQGALRLFFAGRYAPLPQSLNWKPYWGPNAKAEIIHFHGPKPPQVSAMLDGRGGEYPKVLQDLLAADPEYYRVLVESWKDYAARAERM